MQSGTGIQELMAAETRASQIVAEARIGEFDLIVEAVETAMVRDGYFFVIVDFSERSVFVRFLVVIAREIYGSRRNRQCETRSNIMSSFLLTPQAAVTA